MLGVDRPRTNDRERLFGDGTNAVLTHLEGSHGCVYRRDPSLVKNNVVVPREAKEGVTPALGQEAIRAHGTDSGRVIHVIRRKRHAFALEGYLPPKFKSGGTSELARCLVG